MSSITASGTRATATREQGAYLPPDTADPLFFLEGYSISERLVRFLVALATTIGIGWLALHEPSFTDSHINATVSCDPILFPGLGGVNDHGPRLASDDAAAQDAYDAYMNAQPEGAQSTTRDLLELDWARQCSVARTNTQTHLFFFGLITIALFFLVPRKVRIALPSRQRIAGRNDEPDTARGPTRTGLENTTATHTVSITTADAANTTAKAAKGPAASAAGESHRPTAAYIARLLVFLISVGGIGWIGFTESGFHDRHTGTTIQCAPILYPTVGAVDATLVRPTGKTAAAYEEILLESENLYVEAAAPLISEDWAASCQSARSIRQSNIFVLTVFAIILFFLIPVRPRRPRPHPGTPRRPRRAVGEDRNTDHETEEVGDGGQNASPST